MIRCGFEIIRYLTKFTVKSHFNSAILSGKVP